MSTSIAPYFSIELNALNESANIAMKEMEGLRTKLLSVIQQDGVIDLGKNVETLLAFLSDIKQLFEMMQKEIEKQQSRLKIDETFVDDIVINEKLRNEQDAIRTRMLETEKHYLDIKYSCLEFLSRLL